MSEKVVHIRNRKLSKKPRVFDATIDDESGKILKIEVQNVKEQFVDGEDFREQIQEAIASRHK